MKSIAAICCVIALGTVITLFVVGSLRHDAKGVPMDAAGPAIGCPQCQKVAKQTEPYHYHCEHCGADFCARARSFEIEFFSCQ